MSDVIDRLKKNERPFGLMDEDMQDKAKEIGRNEFVEFRHIKKWLNVTDSFSNGTTYQLRKDYTESTGFVERRIYVNETVLCFDDGGEPTCIHSAIASDCFIGFKYDDGAITPFARLYKLESGDTQHLYYPVMGEYEVLTPTAVLFKETL